MKSTQQGAATSVFAATARELEGASGEYLLDCKVGGEAAAGAAGLQQGRSRTAAGASICRRNELPLARSCRARRARPPAHPPSRAQVAAASKTGRDGELARRLWDKTEELLAAALAKAGLPADS